MERIHRANLINFGIIPAILSNPQDYDALNHNDELVIDNLLISFLGKRADNDQ